MKEAYVYNLYNADQMVIHRKEWFTLITKNNNMKHGNSFDSTEITPYEFNGTINYDDLSCLIDCIDDTILLPDVKMYSIFELENIDWNEVNRKILITNFNKI